MLEPQRPKYKDIDTTPKALRVSLGSRNLVLTRGDENQSCLNR